MEWEWTAGNILTLVGTGLTAIAISILFQVVRGKADRTFDFATSTAHEGRRLLMCVVKNQPVRNIPRWLFGACPSARITAAFDIVDALSGEQIVNISHAKFRSHSREFSPTLPPDPGLIVVWHHNFAAVVGQEEEAFRILLPGTYVARVTILMGHNTVIHHRQFVIGVSKELTRWAD